MDEIYKNSLKSVKKTNKYRKITRKSKLFIYNIQKFLPISLSIVTTLGLGAYVIKSGTIDYYNVETIEDLEGNVSSYEQCNHFNNEDNKLIYYNKWQKDKGIYKRVIDVYSLEGYDYNTIKNDLKEGKISNHSLNILPEHRYETSTKIDENKEYYSLVSYSKDMNKPIRKKPGLLVYGKIFLLLALGSFSLFVCKEGPFESANRKLKKMGKYTELDTTFLERKIKKTK